MRKLTTYTLILLALTAFACNRQVAQPEAKGIDILDLDTTANPAVDFDDYANGGWKTRNPLPDEKSRFGTFDKLDDEAEKQVKTLFDEITTGTHTAGTIQQKIADFYYSGMDTATIEEAGIKPLQPYLEQVDKIANIADLQKLVANWHAIQIYPFFFIYADADQKNSEMKVAYLHQGGLRLPDRDYYLNTDEHSLEIQQKYRDFVANIFLLIGEPAENAKADAETIFSIEKKMAELSMSRLDMRDPYKTYNKMTVDKLAEIAPEFNWPGYFEETGISNPGELVVSQPDFFSGVSKMIANEPLETWKTYMKWQFVSRMTSYLPGDFVSLSFDFYGKTLSGSKADRPRWKKVQGTTDSALPEAVGQLYVAKFFPAEAKERMVQLVENLRIALGNRIEQLSWMSDETKQKAAEKLATITVKVGYPDKWKDYSNLQVSRDSYFENVINSGRFDFAEMAGKINKPVDKTEWQMPPQMVNAYYNPSANEIVFPAAILQPPFFYMNADNAINYGAIGVVIGHEMTHGFDDQGRQYDKTGNLNDWWTEDDAKQFKERTDILADQYDQFVVLDTIHANGKLTLGENIADLGGINVALDALKLTLKGDEKEIDGFTPQQRFFLAYAHLWAQNIRDEEKLRLTKTDVHSLGRYRVLGPLRNIPAFYEAFNVNEGDQMYLPDNARAVIW